MLDIEKRFFWMFYRLSGIISPLTFYTLNLDLHDTSIVPPDPVVS